MIKLNYVVLTALKFLNYILAGQNEFWPMPVAAPSAAARLLGERVRIPPGHGCLSVVSVVCYACRGHCDGPIPRPEEVYVVCMSLRVIRATVTLYTYNG